MKICTKCNTQKPINLFGKDKQKQDGLRSSCKTCKSITDKSYTKTKTGLISRILAHQISSSKVRKHSQPEYTKSELVEYLLNHDEFNIKYENWVLSNYSIKLTPSLDRIEHNIGYKLSNILESLLFNSRF